MNGEAAAGEVVAAHGFKGTADDWIDQAIAAGAEPMVYLIGGGYTWGWRTVPIDELNCFFGLELEIEIEARLIARGRWKQWNQAAEAWERPH